MHALGMFLAAVSALRVPGPLSPRVASYAIQARLTPDNHTVEGHEKLTWRNLQSGDARTLVFHLYMNAFKNEGSTFFKESHGRLRSATAEKHGWGSIDVSKIKVGGVDVTKAWKVDDTLASVQLDQPIPAGAQVEIEIDWKTVLPKVFARTGYHDDFYAIGQWFPKIGVWDCGPPQGCRWRAHQHHAYSEFFSDYGVYDVDFTAPAKYWVGASGVYTGEEAKGAEKVLHFHAEDVHDFAIVASPKFKPVEDTYTDGTGKVKLELLGIPGHEANFPRHLAAARAGLEEFGRRFGPYPYSQLTIVDIPDGAEGAGGMEYPTLITTFDLPVPKGIHELENTTIHELGHQYFYGMVGSDEVEEAWLDEGFTETLTDWGLSNQFGRERSDWDILGHRAAHAELMRLGYRGVATSAPLETRAFDFMSFGSYGSITYAKTNVVLRTLEGLIGPDKMEAAMRAYFERWRFHHPRIDDFVASFDGAYGQDLTWFWQPALRSTAVLDYEVLSIANREKHALAGLFDADGGARKEVEPDEKAKAPWSSEVVVHRRGDFVFPVILKVVFQAKDGEPPVEKIEHWDGGRDGPTWKRFTYEGDQKVAWATVDPDDKVPLDVNRWNNGLRAEPDDGPRARVTGTFSSLVSTLLAWVGF
jgi:hypothetical protein